MRQSRVLLVRARLRAASRHEVDGKLGETKKREVADFAGSPGWIRTWSKTPNRTGLLGKSQTMYPQKYPQRPHLHYLNVRRHLAGRPVNYPNSANSRLPHVGRCGSGSRCPIGACPRLSKQHVVHRAEARRPFEFQRREGSADTQREAGVVGLRIADAVGLGAMACQQRVGRTAPHPTKRPAIRQAPALTM
jgi:hypothetical protein